ncbi:anthocyanidin 5,3-O-glucosyltransferase-like isoform X2 [Triticum urartu]|uniref:anthocyanidin 5,3-O-glucosyltransferase-like isoform X2 n=1 Tax=Triticum urartu TaxID=4572 RepID=UPI002043432B|nr:anthocyanidin 5,3-O-glucosyltransferase-like isoform X2 [Triticum urartu]
MKKTVVLYPGLGVGHLVPMVEVAKLFLKHGLAVTVALVEPQVESTDFSAAVARARASNPSVAFHVLPSPPADSNPDGAPRHHVVKVIQLLAAMNAPLRDFLRSLPAVHALVLDMFCVDAQDVAAELKLPVYYSFASAAADLAIFLNLPSKFASNTAKVKELGDSIITFPGVPPFKASELPSEVIGDDEALVYVLRMFERMAEAKGILINSFDSLEEPALSALNDGLCVPGRATPPVYCIGPLVSGGGDKEHECLRWLDAQPDQSVVFLSFGSLGTFSSKQLEEIAVGLEKSGERFLWVVRSPHSPDQKHGDPLLEPDLDALMPEGFLERTKDRGLVVKSWAPQVEVLRHRATGAFMTHCGWNSTLEGITAGLPLLCWPLYAEQKVNKVHIVEGMKLGVEMRGYSEEVVKAEEVEEKVRWVMASEGGMALRVRVAAAKDAAAEALQEGGSSNLAFAQFLKDMDISKVLGTQDLGEHFHRYMPQQAFQQVQHFSDMKKKCFS